MNEFKGKHTQGAVSQHRDVRAVALDAEVLCNVGGVHHSAIAASAATSNHNFAWRIHVIVHPPQHGLYVVVAVVVVQSAASKQ